MDFVRFPHTPHLAWLGAKKPRDDKLLTRHEVDELLRGQVTVEEKVDGANVGISTDEQGHLRVQNRGGYLLRGKVHEQFKPIFHWLEIRAHELSKALFPDLILFGEWCYAVHSVHYDRLPDWFLAFDVFDCTSDRFWSTTRRNALVERIGLCRVPLLAKGVFDLPRLITLLGESRLTNGPAEGLYVRRDQGDFLESRAKLVRPEFAQAIEEHWSTRKLRANDLS